MNINHPDAIEEKNREVEQGRVRRLALTLKQKEVARLLERYRYSCCELAIIESNMRRDDEASKAGA